MSDTPDGNDVFDYDPETNVYRVDFDPARERPSLVLVSAVAEITGREATDLPFLQEDLSPESLDDLFAPTDSGRSRGPGRVEFPYHSFDVTVHSDGRIGLRPTDADETEADAEPETDAKSEPKTDRELRTDAEPETDKESETGPG